MFVKCGNDSDVVHAMTQLSKVFAISAVAVPDSLTIERLQEILEYEIEKLQERKGTASSKLDTIQARCEISDSKFEKFGYVDEEILAAISKYIPDLPMLQGYVARISRAYYELIS